MQAHAQFRGVVTMTIRTCCGALCFYRPSAEASMYRLTGSDSGPSWWYMLCRWEAIGPVICFLPLNTITEREHTSIMLRSYLITVMHIVWAT